MYPRNAASPERISIGPVVLIADGTVQTSGVTVRILPFGGSEADGAGTTAYSTDGVVLYTPTQAETNYTSFVLIAKKSACIPANVTVVTSASSTAGHAGTDQSKITNATSTVNLSNTTIKTATDIETDTQDIQNRLPAALVDGRIVAQAQSVTDKSGYTLTQAFPSNFSSMVINGGNGHVAAALHNAQPNSSPEDAFQNGAVSARVIATDAIDGDAMAASALTEIANAVGTLQVLVDMGLMIINDGTADARFSISALQNGPAGEGGAVINVYPVSASTPERVAGTTITYYRNEIRTVSVVTDFTLTSLTLTFTVEDSEGTDLLTIANASISRSDKTFTVSIGTAVTATISNYRWALRDITGGTNSVIARGVLTVQEAASA